MNFLVDEEEIVRLRRDSERYAWLRKNVTKTTLITEEELDALIDDSIASSKEWEAKYDEES